MPVVHIHSRFFSWEGYQSSLDLGMVQVWVLRDEEVKADKRLRYPPKSSVGGTILWLP